MKTIYAALAISGGKWYARSVNTGVQNMEVQILWLKEQKIW